MTPAVPGVLTAASVRATAHSIAAAQEPSGAIGWPDGHVDVWDHVECARALSAAGLTGPARRAYAWLSRAQRAGPRWPGMGGAVVPRDRRRVSPMAAV